MKIKFYRGMFRIFIVFSLIYFFVVITINSDDVLYCYLFIFDKEKILYKEVNSLNERLSEIDLIIEQAEIGDFVKANKFIDQHISLEELFDTLDNANTTKDKTKHKSISEMSNIEKIEFIKNKKNNTSRHIAESSIHTITSPKDRLSLEWISDYLLVVSIFFFSIFIFLPILASITKFILGWIRDGFI